MQIEKLKPEYLILISLADSSLFEDNLFFQMSHISIFKKWGENSTVLNFRRDKNQ